MRLTPKSGEPVEHCDKVQVYHGQSKDISSEIVVEQDKKYEKLVIMAHDQYVLTSFDGEKVCLATREAKRKIYKVSKFTSNIQSVSQTCVSACIKIKEKVPLNLTYYQQTWDEPSNDDSTVIKYIKVNVKYDDGSKDNFGDYVKSQPFVVLVLVTVQLLQGLLNKL